MALSSSAKRGSLSTRVDRWLNPERRTLCNSTSSTQSRRCSACPWANCGNASPNCSARPRRPATAPGSSSESPGECKPWPKATCPNAPERRAAELACDADFRLNHPRSKTTPATPPGAGQRPNAQRSPTAAAGHHPDPTLQGTATACASTHRRLCLCRSGLSLAQRGGQGHHRHAHQRLPLLPQYPQPQEGDRMNHPSKKAAATLPLVRCAIYTVTPRRIT